jgi:hypothetical protein
MIGKVLKSAALIFGILLIIFSLNGCDRVKASIGFKWGQIQYKDNYREVKNIQKQMDSAVKFEQKGTIEIGSGKAFSEFSKTPA